tara:strand:- start:15 stop:614 length:600 start_codon:yes stop_codon:yes gene_type:complete
MEENLNQENEVNNEMSGIVDESNDKKIKISNPEKINDQEKEINKDDDNGINSKNDLISKVERKDENKPPIKPVTKPKKELPIEKKPFQEFINVHLIPELKKEIYQRGLEIITINFENTNRPIAGDKCWVINCEIKDTCSFWLSFEKEDISSLKSISLSKPNQNPSIIESFLIDEKRITLKLIISRVLQRLNGQKLIGVN